MVLTSYPNPDAIFSLHYKEGVLLIIDLAEQKKEQRTWEFYLTLQQTLVLLNPWKDESEQLEFKSYDDFKSEMENCVGARFTEDEKMELRNNAKAFNERLGEK